MSSRIETAEHPVDVRDDGVHVEQSWLQHLLPAERQDLTGQLGRAMRRGDDDLGIIAFGVIGTNALEERLPGPEDHRQEVVEVMGDTGGETPDGDIFSDVSSGRSRFNRVLATFSWVMSSEITRR